MNFNTTETYSYSLIYAHTSGPLTTYKVSVVSSGGVIVVNDTSWLLSNGTVLASYTNGFNSTLSSAYAQFSLDFSPFLTLSEFNASPSVLAPSAQVSPGALTSISIGSVTMMVTNYEPNSLPVIIGPCGSVFSIENFTLQAGVVPGTQFDLLTLANLSGTQQSPTGPFQFQIYIRVISITAST